MPDPGLVAFAVEQVTGELGEHAAPDALEARRMQALSLAVHIPLVCFGIAFPAMFLFVHGLYLRTGRPHYKALAKRWSKVALILFAVGVVTGTILSFEFGLLWPDFMATFGEVFGLELTRCGAPDRKRSIGSRNMISSRASGAARAISRGVQKSCM